MYLSLFYIFTLSKTTQQVELFVCLFVTYPLNQVLHLELGSNNNRSTFTWIHTIHLITFNWIRRKLGLILLLPNFSFFSYQITKK